MKDRRRGRLPSGRQTRSAHSVADRSSPRRLAARRLAMPPEFSLGRWAVVSLFGACVGLFFGFMAVAVLERSGIYGLIPGLTLMGCMGAGLGVSQVTSLPHGVSARPWFVATLGGALVGAAFLVLAVESRHPVSPWAFLAFAAGGLVAGAIQHVVLWVSSLPGRTPWFLVSSVAWLVGALAAIGATYPFTPRPGASGTAFLYFFARVAVFATVSAAIIGAELRALVEMRKESEEDLAVEP